MAISAAATTVVNVGLCCRKCWQVWIALRCQATPAALRIGHMLLKKSSFEEKMWSGNFKVARSKYLFHRGSDGRCPL